MQNQCCGCKRQLHDKELVTTLIAGVEVCVNKFNDEEMRLKLSTNGINERTTLVYCQKCLPLKIFGVS